MGPFHDKLRRLATLGKVRVSVHGYDELADDNLGVRETIAGLHDAILIEEYPGFAKGHCALFQQEDASGTPVHVVWGIPKGYDEPVVLVTAYRPDPRKWDQTFRKRLKP